MPTYHVGGNLIRCIPIQVELECHHLVVVCLQLTLHHLVTRVANLRNTGVVRPGRRLLPASHAPTGPPRVAPHIQDGQPGTAGPLLARARARGSAVMFPGGLAFQFPPTKCALTAVTQLSSRSDVRTSIAGKPRMLLHPQKRPAMQASLIGEVWLFRKLPEALESECSQLENPFPAEKPPSPQPLLPVLGVLRLWGTHGLSDPGPWHSQPPDL